MSKVNKYIRKHLLSPKHNSNSLIGVLREAHLVSTEQMEMALKQQMDNPALSISEILVRQKWLKSKTSAFFAEDWSQLIKLKERKSLGYYLEQAGLLEQQDIQKIVQEQEVNQLRFGALAVLNGYIKPETLEFFLFYLFPQELEESHLRTSKSFKKSRQRKRQLIVSLMNRKKSHYL